MLSNIVPTVGHKNPVSLLSFLVLRCLVGHTTLNLPNFILKHMLATKGITSPTSLPYGALLTTIIQHFGVDCSNEPSDSSSKPLDKRTTAKSLRQSSRAPPARESNMDFIEETNVLGSPLVACGSSSLLSPIMIQLMRMSTCLDEHINGSCTSFNKMRDRLDGESRASFKEIRDHLDDIYECLPSSPTLAFLLFGDT